MSDGPIRQSRDDINEAAAIRADRIARAVAAWGVLDPEGQPAFLRAARRVNLLIDNDELEDGIERSSN